MPKLTKRAISYRRTDGRNDHDYGKASLLTRMITFIKKKKFMRSDEKISIDKLIKTTLYISKKFYISKLDRHRNHPLKIRVIGRPTIKI